MALDRKGVEIAVSTIIVLVIGMVIISLGSVFVWNIVEGGQKIAEGLTGQTKQGLRELITAGKLVAVYPSNVNLKAGDQTVVGIGIQNRLSETTTFMIDVDGFDEQKSPIGASEKWWAFNPLGPLAPEDSLEVGLIVRPPSDAPPGTYTFVVAVLYEDVAGEEIQYGSKQIFTVQYR